MSIDSLTRKSDSEYSQKYNEKRQAKQIKVAMYSDDPIEKQLYESWQKEDNKKQLFMKMYIEYLAKKDAANADEK